MRRTARWQGGLPARRKRLGLHVLHQAFRDLEDLPRIVVWCEPRVMRRAFGCIRPIWMALHDLERRAIRPICGARDGSLDAEAVQARANVVEK